MKELTIEEKAQRYNEILERAKAEYAKFEGMLPGDVLEDVISELKESDDNKIRKEIVNYFRCQSRDEPLRKDIHNKWIAWLEKQGEQKLADKTEPKFKVGDYVVGKYISGYISEIRDDCYFLDYQGFPIDKQDNYHLWTIQDANDGDVLCDYHEAFNNPLIFILKKFEHVDFGLVMPSDYSSYCFLTAGDRQRFKEGTYHHKNNIKPATKEQRDFLFKKMKEAGYEWDAEKKELKKVVVPIFNVGDTIVEKDHYEQCVQYDSIKAGIQAHAETYSFNIESKLFPQLTKEQQKLWKEEIKEACISGGDVGYLLAKDTLYKENFEVKDVDLEEEMSKEWNKCKPIDEGMGLEIASIEHE